VQTTWAEFADAAPDVVVVDAVRLPPGRRDRAGARGGWPRCRGRPVWAIDAGRHRRAARPARRRRWVEAIAAILHPDAVTAPPAGAIALVTGAQP
jgi:iron complex transport system substrate-binding protein